MNNSYPENWPQFYTASLSQRPRWETLLGSKFPELKTTQIAVLRADVKTGHVLDENYNLALNDHQIVYTVFEAIEEALHYSEKILSEKQDIEIVIYDSQKKMLHYLT